MVVISLMATIRQSAANVNQTTRLNAKVNLWLRRRVRRQAIKLKLLLEKVVQCTKVMVLEWSHLGTPNVPLNKKLQDKSKSSYFSTIHSITTSTNLYYSVTATTGNSGFLGALCTGL